MRSMGEYAVIICGAVLFSALAAVLLRLNMDNEQPAADAEELPAAETAAAAEAEAQTSDPDAERQKMPWGYVILSFVVNLLTACYMKLMFSTDPVEILNILALFSILWPCAWIDRKSFRIPNRILLVGVGLWALFTGIEVLRSPSDLGYYLASSGIACAAMLIATLLCKAVSKDAIGMGDIKLLALMGLFLRTDRIWGAVIFSVLVSFVYSLYLLIAKKANRKTEIAFAPLTLIGTVLSVFLMIV